MKYNLRANRIAKAEKKTTKTTKPVAKTTKTAKVSKEVIDESPTKSKGDISNFYNKRMDAMEKRFNLTSSEINVPDRLSTGFLMVDYVCGGGLVPGSMAQVSGVEKGSKSTLCMHTLGSAIVNKVPIIQYWDAENAITDPRYAEAVIRRQIGKIFFGPERVGRLYAESILEDFYNGSKSLMRSVPDKLYRSDRKAWFFVFDADKAGREMMHAAGFSDKSYDKDLFKASGRLWCQTDLVGQQGIIFCDSYPALVPADVEESDEDMRAMALDARAFSKNIKKVKGVLKRKGFTVLGVNQIRQKPGFNMGNPEYEPGGEALKFYSDMRLQNRPRAVPSGWDNGRKEDGGKTTEFGQERSIFGRGWDKYNYVYIKNTKNKTGLPYLGTFMRVWFTDGEGRPHGYDPVFDTFYYLKMTGRIAGRRGDKKGFKILLDIPDLKGKTFTWLEFKMLILAPLYPKRQITIEGKKGKSETINLAQHALNTFKFKKGLLDIRKELFKELKSGKCYELASSSVNASDDDDEDLEA